MCLSPCQILEAEIRTFRDRSTPRPRLRSRIRAWRFKSAQSRHSLARPALRTVERVKLKINSVGFVALPKWQDPNFRTLHAVNRVPPRPGTLTSTLDDCSPLVGSPLQWTNLPLANKGCPIERVWVDVSYSQLCITKRLNSRLTVYKLFVEDGH